MKLEASEKKDFSTPPTSEVPSYPHGLKICLGSEEMKKLGMMSLPEVNAKFKLEAVVEVVEVSSQDHGEGKKPRLELQIVDMELKSKDEKANVSDHQVIYGE